MFVAVVADVVVVSMVTVSIVISVALLCLIVGWGSWRWQRRRTLLNLIADFARLYPLSSSAGI